MKTNYLIWTVLGHVNVSTTQTQNLKINHLPIWNLEFSFARSIQYDLQIKTVELQNTSLSKLAE